MPIENTRRLTHAGPRDEEHGFPLWFEDDEGHRLGLGVGSGITTDPRLPAVGELPDPGAPIRFPANFPDESFYFLAEARMSVAGADGPTRARLILAIEAAFGGTGEVSATAPVVFSRIRVRVDDLVPGASYVVTHPYGVSGPLAADDRGRLFVTDDRGIADEQLEQVLTAGVVAPFLVATGAPPGYLGGGVTPTTVTGSPFGTNIFRIEGPGIGALPESRDPARPDDLDRAQTDLFTVQGRIADRLGVAADAATYTRDSAGGVTVHVHARSAPDQLLELDSPQTGRVALAVQGRHGVVAASAAAVPAQIRLVNASDSPPTAVHVPVVDRVGATAVHDLDARTLTVTATSSDPAATLTVVDHGPLPTPSVPTVFPDVTATAAHITVRSSGGGQVDAPVTVTGAPAPRLPLVADAGGALAAVAGEAFALDASGSRPDAQTYAWSHAAGPAVVIADPAAARTTAVAATPGTLLLRLEVTAAGAVAQDEVSVAVSAAPAPDRIDAVRASYRTRTRQFRLDGTLAGTLPAQVAATFRGEPLGRAAVDATGAWSLRHTLTAAQLHLVPGVGDAVELSSTRGGHRAAALAIRA